jgi:hypothetical protein
MGRTALVFVSGRILALDAGRRVVTLEEVGPWMGGQAGRVTWRIQLTSATRVEFVSRARVTAGGWEGGFKHAPLGAAHLRVGDYVTVTTESRHGYCLAVAVTAMRPETAASAAAGQQAGLSRPGR